MEFPMLMSLETIDWIVIAGYFALLLGLAWWVILKTKNTADDYFLAGRNLGWFVIGASIFASNIGSEHLVGLAGSGCTDGVAMAHYELHAWCLLVLGWMMVPFYMRSKVYTMPEFLERRFSPNARWLLSLISLVAYVLTKIAVGIFAGGVVFSVLLPEMQFMGLDSFWLGSILVVVMTGLYTILGGFRAVAYTEALQTVILIVGSVLVTIFGLKALGGWERLREVCGSDYFNLWKPLVPETVNGIKTVATWAPVNEVVTGANGEKVHRMAWYFNSNYPWLSMLFCAPVVGLWYWCTDQYIVQRCLGAPNEKEARRGTLFSAFLKLLPVFIFIIPGMICFALAVGGPAPAARDGGAEPTAVVAAAEDGQVALTAGVQRIQDVLLQKEADGSVKLDSDNRPVLKSEEAQAAFPLLVAHILPVGIRGIVVAGLLAALMSSLAGVFNASSTLFTMDFYSRLHPNATQQQIVWVGRVATAVLVVVGLLWIPVIKGSRGLYDYLQGVQAYLAPPIFVVFFLGVFNKRLNSKGCMAALIVGFLMGIFRLAIDTPVTLTKFSENPFVYEPGTFFWIMNQMFFQYYSIVILVVCIVVMFAVSYATNVPPEAKISGLTFATISHEDKQKSRSSWTMLDVVLSILLLVIIAVVYLYFRG